MNVAQRATQNVEFAEPAGKKWSVCTVAHGKEDAQVLQRTVADKVYELLASHWLKRTAVD